MAKEATSGPLASDDTLTERVPRTIRCRACDATLTDAAHAIAMAGSHHHVFENPAGLAFEILCFRRADGCDSVATPTFEATWFAEHAWSFAICRRCQTHLGWAYWRADEIRFWGLMTDRLIDAS